MDIKQMLKDLTETRGLSGFENNIALKLKNILKKYCTKVDIDKYKSIIGYIPCGKKNAKKIMLEAHLDQIGLMVSEIDNKGRVGFINLGGVDERILPGSEVYIVGKSKEIFGIIAEKNTIQNYTTDEKKVKNSKIEELFIDTGYTKKDIEKNIQIGS
ncbi:MAG: M42 family peptidase, partial [Oscillospiraceae bacterium]